MKLPDWLVPFREHWLGFVELRKAMRRPFTERAQQLTIAKLERLRDQGYNPGAVLDQSTRCGWCGVFPTRQDPVQADRQEQQHAHYSATDKAYYEKFYQEHPELKPEWWRS